MPVSARSALRIRTAILGASFALSSGLFLSVAAQEISGVSGTAEPAPARMRAQSDVSPARLFMRDPRPQTRQIEESHDRFDVRREFRSFDGSGNNPRYPEFGAAFIHLMRLTPSDYSDGISALAGANRKSARIISNYVAAQEALMPNPDGLSDFFWQWGQFLDHDIGLTEGVDPPEAANIPVPGGDVFFDPDDTRIVEIALNRSIYDPDTGTAADTPREQENEITAWIDGSNIYGSDESRAEALRTLDGTGRLKVSDGNLLPFNTDGLANAGDNADMGFLAGDPRANEQVGLAAMHTLFVREHNRIAEALYADNPLAGGYQIYQRARAQVIAILQVITYEEFLPALLGPQPLPAYQGYNEFVRPDLSTEFTTAAFRFGHSALSPQLLRLGADGAEIAEGHLPLRDAFFRPDRLVTEGGIDPILRGLASQVCQQLDSRVIDDVRNFLFGQPGAGGFDLAALNIQRGRDHGLPGYNDVRRGLGLEPASILMDITTDDVTRYDLRRSYSGDVEKVELWTGGLAEAPVNGGQVGETFHTIIRDQFIALRDGDRFWYERVFRGRKLRELRATRLADVIRRNTDIDSELQDDVFRVADR